MRVSPVYDVEPQYVPEYAQIVDELKLISASFISSASKTINGNVLNAAGMISPPRLQQRKKAAFLMQGKVFTMLEAALSK